MRPLALLKCVAKAALKQAANLAGFGLGDAAQEVLDDWQKDRDAAQRQAEIQEVLRMAADQFRAQVEAVVREVAAGQPPQVRQSVSRWLEELPDKLRQSQELVSLLSGDRPAPPPTARVTLTLT